VARESGQAGRKHAESLHDPRRSKQAYGSRHGKPVTPR
jgi:hypothetical protein